MTVGYHLKKLREHPELAGRGADWYHAKWKVPLAAYQESIGACLRGEGPVPQWYLVLDEMGAIAAGAGVIENDFHDRPDLRPNVCAVFVEPEHRKRGLARELLDEIRYDMARLGEGRLYLVTNHTQFYERCGWTYHTEVRDTESGKAFRLYTVETGGETLQTGKNHV